MRTFRIVAWLSAMCLMFVVFDVGAKDLKLKVSSLAGGKFGSQEGIRNKNSQSMAKAYVFEKPGTITIKAKGYIDLHPDILDAQRITPNGLRPFSRPSGVYTPLEEAIVDAKGLFTLSPTIKHAGALIGAFIPAAKANSPNFRPWNDEFGGGISSDKLFLIGKGPKKFTATELGTLFLGVNDPRSANNWGTFRVLITPTP